MTKFLLVCKETNDVPAIYINMLNVRKIEFDTTADEDGEGTIDVYYLNGDTESINQPIDETIDIMELMNVF